MVLDLLLKSHAAIADEDIVDLLKVKVDVVVIMCVLSLMSLVLLFHILLSLVHLGLLRVIVAIGLILGLWSLPFVAGTRGGIAHILLFVG